MKKIFLFLVIFSTLYSPFTTKAQDSTEMAWAKHIKSALDNRPNPSRFGEQEAWEVLTKGESSQIFEFSEKDFKNFHFQVKEKKWSENYSRSYTASKDDWWYTTTISFDEGEWVINWSFFINISLALFLFLLANINIKKKLEKNKTKTDKEIYEKNIFVWNTIPAFIVIVISLGIAVFADSILDPLSFLLLYAVFALSLTVSYLRIKWILFKERKRIAMSLLEFCKKYMKAKKQNEEG